MFLTSKIFKLFFSHKRIFCTKSTLQHTINTLFILFLTLKHFWQQLNRFCSQSKRTLKQFSLHFYGVHMKRLVKTYWYFVDGITFLFYLMIQFYEAGKLIDSLMEEVADSMKEFVSFMTFAHHLFCLMELF